jgi:O-antigen/teichoic acid export membrane protein
MSDARSTMSAAELRFGATVLLNALTGFASILISVFAIPFYLKYLGPERFGTLSILWIVFGYLMLFDLGVAAAASNALARLGPDSHDRSRILAAATALSMASGLAGAALLALSANFVFSTFLPQAEDLRDEFLACVPWLCILLPFSLLKGVADRALDAREHFQLVNVVTLAGNLLAQVLPIPFVILLGPNLQVVVLATVIGRIISGALSLAAMLVKIPVQRAELPSRAQLLELSMFGRWVTLIQIVSPVLLGLDQLMVGRLLGPSSVAIYAVAVMLVSRGLQLASALGRTVQPRIARSTGEEARSHLEQALAQFAFCTALGVAVGLVLTRSIFSIWLGADFAVRATPSCQILLVGAWFAGGTIVLYAFLEARGKARITLTIHALQLLPFLGILVLSTKTFGIVGAAWASLARASVDFVAHAAAVGLGLRAMARSARLALLFLPAAAAGALDPVSLPLSGLMSLCVLALGIAMGWMLDETTRRLLRATAAMILGLRVRAPTDGPAT